METWRFITVVTSARHLSLSWSQLDPVHKPTSNFLKIYLNIILPSTPGSPKCSLSFRFPHQNPVHASSLPHTRYMPRPSYSSRLYYPNSIGWAVQIIKLLIHYVVFSTPPATSSVLGPSILLKPLFSNTLSLRSSLNVSDQVSHPYKTTRKFIVLYNLTFKFLDIKLEKKRFRTEGEQ